MSADLDTKAAFKQILSFRHSCRGFKSDAVDKETIASIVEDAQKSCSNCNTQPWHVIIVSGQKLKELSDAYIAAFDQEGFSNGTGDFVFNQELFEGAYRERQKEQGRALYAATGVPRGDNAALVKSMHDQFRMFNAPHVALLFMPDIKDGNVRQAGDIGHYGMTFMLSCAAHGVACLPQTILGMKSEVPRKLFNVPDNYKMLYGISFGYEDPSAPGNSFRIGRAPTEQSVQYLE